MFGLPDISISAAGFSMPPGSPARATIDSIAALGVRGITLDATAPGLRPRELSRSGRRDIASVLRRNELELAGLDLWIPPEHFADPATTQRAIDAATLALEMSTELASLVGSRSRPVVSLVLPPELDSTARASLDAIAQQCGSTLADHAIMNEDTTRPPGIGVGIDPVYYLTDGQSPAKAITRAGDHLASARLCDTNAMGRCAVGSTGSKLDTTAYAGALIVSGLPWVTLDLRGLSDPMTASSRAIAAWNDAGRLPRS